ncbi:hypothetical protein F2Q70_00040225 [Brassica cretica]|uniref:Uncharacterized protein n=1 Tax=Brassica cretica TaxID=69181 RepID=A0A8S9KB19_BRACR|nr:hypothetical protein F2Q70_00040225 [Brassica cretica]
MGHASTIHASFSLFSLFLSRLEQKKSESLESAKLRLISPASFFTSLHDESIGDMYRLCASLSPLRLCLLFAFPLLRLSFAFPSLCLSFASPSVFREISSTMKHWASLSVDLLGSDGPLSVCLSSNRKQVLIILFGCSIMHVSRWMHWEWRFFSILRCGKSRASNFFSVQHRRTKLKWALYLFRDPFFTNNRRWMDQRDIRKVHRTNEEMKYRSFP